MKITIVTLFPNMIKGFIEESIVKRAVLQKLVEIKIINLRDFSEDKYRTVDGRPYGGGAGMILRVDVLQRAIKSLNLQKQTARIILTSARGKVFNQKKALELSKQKNLVIIAGHYEGVDERMIDSIDEELSIGDFVLTGGEIATAAFVDAIVRLVPGVLKKEKATTEESFFDLSIDRLIEVVGENEILMKLKKEGKTKVTLLEYPQYTRPEEYEGKKVPAVLLSGNPKLITDWQLKKAFEETLKKRPDLLTKGV